MEVVEYWHGTIENYRYDGDVSTSYFDSAILLDEAAQTDIT